jgi:L-alanine-DL-glutamate epimerase-like enolase superfamily enzyme
MVRSKTIIEQLKVAAYTVPNETPSGDGTKLWDSVTIVTVHASSDGQTGFGYTYADSSTAKLILEHLERAVCGLDAMSIPAAWHSMNRAVRDLGGQTGLSQIAISAVDTALWDLKARLLNLPLVDLLGSVRDGAVVYGSGGYVTYTKDQLQEQLGGWASDGLSLVKMKIGRNPDQDCERVAWAREAIGPAVRLMVDANGAYTVKEALDFSQRFKALGVVWFEEPVPSSDLCGLKQLRGAVPAPIEIAAGEYGSRLDYYRRMIESSAVDVVQADASRCGGFTSFMGVNAICQSWNMPLSAHCAPSLHAHVGAAAVKLRHLEYFHDHTRVEKMLMDGVPVPNRDGRLIPDRSRPGNGLIFKFADAERYVAG